MEFAPQQDEALKAVSRWLKEGRSPLFRLFGYAGTGKTTLARHFAENVEGEVLFAAFTGKAAQVLRSKGAKNARTIHSLIYRPRGEEEVSDEETGKTSIAPMFSINRQSPVAKAALIIIDECSMVDEALGRDLMSFGTPILVLGDPGQLPPVSGGGYFTNEEPDYLLTDIHRQARDNPIIQLAMHVREGKEIMHGDYGSTARIISKNEVTQDLVLEPIRCWSAPTRPAALQSAPARTEGLYHRISAVRRQARLPAQRPRQGPAQRLALAGDDLVQGNGEARHQPDDPPGR
jgi:exodeoxyribonuclease-5